MDPFTIFVAVVSIISGVASYQQAKKMQREADRESRGVEANIESNIKAIPVIYGERRVGGTRVYIDTSKDIGNKYLYMVMAMAEGEVEDIHSIEIDDVPITDEKFILSGLGANFTYEIFYGSDTQSASDLIIDGVAYSSAAEVPPEVAIYLSGQESDKPWNQNHKLNGVAYLAMRFLWDTNAYNGVPNVTAIVKGKKVYDPRNPTAPKAWSNNPALCIRDYLTSSRYGKGIPESAINDTMFSQAANDYDSFIVTPYDGGDDITLFELNTVIDTEVQIINNLNDMLMSCRGFLPYVDGKYGIRVDQATNHVMDVSSDHIIGGISIVGTKKEDRFNQVKVNFFNKDKEYKEDTAVFPDVDDPSDVNNLYQQYLAEDGGEPLVDDIKIDGISNYYTAREMAKLFLLRSRLGTAIAFRGTSELMELEVGDTFLITQPTPAWTNKKFQVQEIGLNFDGTVNIQAIEYSDSIYTYNEASEETPFVPTKLPDPNKLAPVTALSPSAGTDISADGKTISFIDLSWTAPNDALVDRYEIKYTIDDVTSVVYSAVAIDPTHRIVDAEGSYDISVYAVNGFGAKSTGVTLSNVLSVTDTTAPSDITSISVVGGLQSISLNWTNPTEYDFDLVRIKVADKNAQPASHTFEVRSDSFVHDIGAYSTTKHYWLAPVDRTGNEGDYVSGGSATTGSIAIGDVPAVAGTFYLTIANDNVITDDKFLAAIGRNPIEGDVVVLNKEYFFTRGESAWEAVTEFIDGSLLVSDSVTANEINTNTVLTESLLANTANITGDLTVTSGKITIQDTDTIINLDPDAQYPFRISQGAEDVVRLGSSTLDPFIKGAFIRGMPVQSINEADLTTFVRNVVGVTSEEKTETETLTRLPSGGNLTYLEANNITTGLTTVLTLESIEGTQSWLYEYANESDWSSGDFAVFNYTVQGYNGSTWENVPLWVNRPVFASGYRISGALIGWSISESYSVTIENNTYTHFRMVVGNMPDEFGGGLHPTSTGINCDFKLTSVTGSQVNSDNYVDSFSISDTTGVITVGRTGALGNLTADISTYVGNKVSELVDSAPATLDTLNELAAALGDDANFSTTMTTALGTKITQADGDARYALNSSVVNTVYQKEMNTSSAGYVSFEFTGYVNTIGRDFYIFDVIGYKDFRDAKSFVHYTVYLNCKGIFGGTLADNTITADVIAHNQSDDANLTFKLERNLAPDNKHKLWIGIDEGYSGIQILHYPTYIGDLTRVSSADFDFSSTAPTTTTVFEPSIPVLSSGYNKTNWDDAYEQQHSWEWRWQRWQGTVQPSADTTEQWQSYYNTYFVKRTTAIETAHPFQDGGYLNTIDDVDSTGGFGGSTYGNMFGNLSTYHCLIYTNIYVDKEFTVNITNFSGDDPHAIFVDGKFVHGRIPCCTDTAYNYTFTQGWHRIDLVYSEGGGGDWIRMGWNPKDYTANISDMTPHRGSENPVYLSDKINAVNNSSNWDTAYGWGDHSTQGYLTSISTPREIAYGNSTISGSNSFRLAGTGIQTRFSIVGYNEQDTEWEWRFTQADDATPVPVNVMTLTPTSSTSANLSVTGTLSASGYNNTNWDTAYGWGDHSTAGYLTSYTESDTLATVTGRGATTTNAVTVGSLTTGTSGDINTGLYANINSYGNVKATNGGFQIGTQNVIDSSRNLTNIANVDYTGSVTNTNTRHEWRSDYTLNNTTPKELLYKDGSALPDGGVYRFSAHISGTGTDNWATAVYWNQNGTWKLNVTQQSGISSNNPEFIISGGKPTLHIDHPNNYGVTVFSERLELSEGTGTDNNAGFGADSFMGSVGQTLRYNPNGGASNFDYGWNVFHDAYHPNADKWTTARTLALTGDVTGSVSWDGSGNASLTATVANDSHTHDGRYYNKNNPIENFNPFTSDKLHSSTETNMLAGKGSKLKVTIDGVESPSTATLLTNLNYEDRAVKGFQNDPDKVINIDLVTNGLYGSSGITYAAGFVVLNFYSSPFPSGYSARVRNKDNVWTPMTLVKVGTTLRGDIPIGNYITDLEFTLSSGTTGPFVTGTEVWGLSDIAYYGTRMSLSQGPLITSIGGYIDGNLSFGKTSGAPFYVNSESVVPKLNADKLDGQHGSYYAPASHNHNDLYYTEAESDSRFVNVTGDTMTGNLTIGNNKILGDLATNYLNLGTTPELVTVRSLEIRADDDDSSDTEYLLLSAGQNKLKVQSTASAGTDNQKLTYNDNKVFHDAYHPNADKWTTASTLSLTGDVTGSVSWDGSANASITTAVANDSHSHSNYITSNADDSYSGSITATGADWYLWSLGARGASAGAYGIGNRNDDSFRQLTFHVPNRAAYSNAGVVPSFGWYSNGAVELMRLASDTGDLTVKSSYQINGTTVVDSSRNLTNINTVTASGLIKGNQLSSLYWVTKQLSGTQMGNSYNERVILLCPKVETTTFWNNIVDGKITMLKSGGNVCDSFDVFCHSVYNDTRATFTSRGQRTGHKLVTCTYGGIKWVAIKFEFTANPYNYALFQGQAYTNVTGHADNQLKIISYYDTLNGGTVLDSEVYNSIADYNPDSTYTVFETSSTTFNSPVYSKSDIRSFYSSTNYAQLESNVSGGVLKLEGNGSTLLRSYGISEFPNGLGIGTTTVIDSSRNLTNIGTISAAGSISVTGYNSVNAYSGAFTYITGALTGNVVGNVTGNASTATKWATLRTITLGGDLTGSVSIDGSANVTLSGQVVNDSHTHDGRYYTETESDSRFVNVTGDTISGNLHFSQNPVGTTYGNGESAVPTRYISQQVGDNDGWRLYGEAPSYNDVKMIFEVVDDNETGDTWVFRNKRTYSPYTATEALLVLPPYQLITPE